MKKNFTLKYKSSHKQVKKLEIHFKYNKTTIFTMDIAYKIIL